MRHFYSFLAMASLVLGLSACTTTTNPPVLSTKGTGTIDHVLVLKDERKLHLINNGQIMRSYDVRLGSNPTGYKVREGDGRTPEGTYRITHRNPQSAYHLSLGI